MNRLKFFILFICFFSYSLQAFSKTIIISDLDDTLKKSNSVGYFPEETYHFLKKVPYFQMRDLFNEIRDNQKANNKSFAFYYVSAAYTVTFNAQDWLQKNHFPAGRSVLKTFKTRAATYDFKYAAIKKILQNEIKNNNENGPLTVLMFGDNSQVDPKVYNDLNLEMGLNAAIYIRDVRADATFFDSSLAVHKMPGLIYYFSEVELFRNAEFNYLSTELILSTYFHYTQKDLIPSYTFKTLNRRLDGLYKDKARAKNDAQKFWNDYYSRL